MIVIILLLMLFFLVDDEGQFFIACSILYDHVSCIHLFCEQYSRLKILSSIGLLKLKNITVFPLMMVLLH